jgi:hypothetical protein
VRGLGRFALAGAAVALSSASFGVPSFTSRFSAFTPGPIILGGGSGSDTLEDRQRRNEAAGGRDKRIKRNKARRSFGRRRAMRGGAPRISKPFLRSDARNAVFLRALNEGVSHNEALKRARRVPRDVPNTGGRPVPVHASGPSPVPNPPHRSGGGLTA